MIPHPSSRTPPEPAALDLEAHFRERCALAGGRSFAQGFGFRRLTPSPVDLRIFAAEPLSPGEQRELAARLEDDPLVESARFKGAALAIRLSEDYVRALGGLLEERAGAGLGPRSALAGRRIVVNYLNPNATKPLHVGHLRNVAVGGALSASLAAAGAEVVRQCYACDIGRNVCEAMAGYERFHAGQEPEALGMRPDQLVGQCYAEYVASGGAGGAADPNGGAAGVDPIGGEGEISGDRADELVRAWMGGDAAARALWERVRGWALSGQRATLARLSASMDRWHYESASLPLAAEMAARGLEAGLFEREPGGAVVYRTGRAEYGAMRLVRADGFPTEHARVLALFLAEQAEADRIDRWSVVCGDEWDAAGQVQLEIARRLGPCPLLPKVQVLMHGMVTLAGSKMKSRDGKAVRIDDFLDELARSPAAAELAGGAIPRERLLDVAVKGFFLSKPLAKSIEFEWEAFLDPTRNPAWALARAWSLSAERSEAGAGAAPRDAEAYRTAALQVHQARQLLSDPLGEFAGTELARFAVGLARWYLERPADPPDPPVDRAVRAVLELCLESLGLARGAA